MTVSAEVVARLVGTHRTVAVAESLTGGLVAATLVDAPGASEAVEGAVVVYTPAAKREVLGVDAELLDRVGTVHGDVARQMAERVRELFGTTYGVSTTGVAGPGPHEGHPAGTVFIGFAGPDRVDAIGVHFEGDRKQVRGGAVERALAYVLECVSE